MKKLPKRIRDYLREQDACCKPSTVAGYRLTLGCFYEYLKQSSAQQSPCGAPKNPLDSLTKRQLQDYLLHLCERDLVPYTKVNYLLSVKKYLQWEVERGKLSGDLLEVLDRSKLPPVPEYLPRPLSSENDLRLQNKLRESDDPQALFFLLLRQTGMRISELINLPPDCVLSGMRSEKYLKVPLGKMNNERLVPLSQESLSLIEKIRQRENPDRLIGMEGKVSQVYGRLSTRFKKISENMEDQGRPVTFHRLRHTYATSLLTAGVSLVSLMKLLGHRRIEMTLRYAKVTPSHLRDEYLKAVKIIEQQTTGKLILPNHESSARHEHPATLIRHAAMFITKNAILDPLPRKNLLLRLSRLQSDLSQIIFSQKSETRGMGTGARAE